MVHNVEAVGGLEVDSGEDKIFVSGDIDEAVKLVLA